METAKRVADRLERKAQDLALFATISEHHRQSLIGYLKSEAALLRGAENTRDVFTCPYCGEIDRRMFGDQLFEERACDHLYNCSKRPEDAEG